MNKVYRRNPLMKSAQVFDIRVFFFCSEFIDVFFNSLALKTNYIYIFQENFTMIFGGVITRLIYHDLVLNNGTDLDGKEDIF